MSLTIRQANSKITKELFNKRGNMTEWLTLDQAGNFLGVSVRTVQRYIKSGKLKTKTIKGRKSLKKEILSKIKADDTSSIDATLSGQDHDNDARSSDTNTPSHQLKIPEGYILIDKETLDSLRIQIKTLTDNVGEMQLTQKMLIEKGLNLKQEASNHLTIDNEQRLEDAKTEIAASDNLKPIEEIAKVHEDFFGKKKSNNLLYYIIGGMAVCFIVFVAFIYLRGI
jgi:hypothetical protein